jgi:hypothetical protein
MAETATIDSAQIHALLAEHGYDVTDTAPNVLSIRQIDSGVTVQAVLEGEILFFSLICLTTPTEKITAEIMREMLSGSNGISTSHFQLYAAAEGRTAVALSNFCKLQELGPDDKDDILSCVHFLFADVLVARDLLAELA